MKAFKNYMESLITPQQLDKLILKEDAVRDTNLIKKILERV